MAATKTILLSQKIPLIAEGGLMAQEWYAFLADKLKLLGTGDQSITDLAMSIAENKATADVTAAKASDLAILMAFT